jgi:hypothetical protein
MKHNNQTHKHLLLTQIVLFLNTQIIYTEHLSNDYFTNITKIYTSSLGSYFLTDTATSSQVWWQWQDPDWSFGPGIDAQNGGFFRKYITESEIPSGYAQLT